MESIGRLRRVYHQAVARFLGTDVDQPGLLVAQKSVSGHHSEIFGLPEMVLSPIQVLDVEDEGFGGFISSLDYDGLGLGRL